MPRSRRTSRSGGSSAASDGHLTWPIEGRGRHERHDGGQFGFSVQVFPSAEAFLASEVVAQTSCLILDIAMPGMSGPELQRELANRQHKVPIVFITGSGDRSIRAKLLAAGAVECLFKPFGETALLDALNAALRTG